MEKSFKYISAIVIAFILFSSAIALKQFSLSGSSATEIKFISKPEVLPMSTIDVKMLGSEINNGQYSVFPIYISEINNGLFYYADNKNKSNVLITRDFLFSKYDSSMSSWSKPISLTKDFPAFKVINKYMNFTEIFITIDDDIYSVDLKKNTFTPQKLNINTKYIECSPCISPDGNTLYFVSNRPGGFGGKDIWSSERLSNGNWSEPVNLGKKVNTPEDEESPFMMADNATLYFSSKGPGSMGGFDIFVSTRNDDGFWSMPENLGTPVNTAGDDFFYITDTYGKRAFYSSDNAKKGNQDIYFVNYKK
jgi:hypothetical protein